MVRDKIKPKTHQEEEHILEMCSLFRETTPIKEILRWISHTFSLKPTKSQIRENRFVVIVVVTAEMKFGCPPLAPKKKIKCALSFRRKKEYVTMRCLDLEKQIATTLNRVKNYEVKQTISK